MRQIYDFLGFALTCETIREYVCPGLQFVLYKDGHKSIFALGLVQRRAQDT